MASSTQSLFSLDPEHISCVGGRTVVTCKGCAGNAPRGAICLNCNGRGFNIFICAHCNPAAAAAAARAMVNPTAASAETPGSSTPSSPSSLSRSSSNSHSSHADPSIARSYGKYGDGRDSTSCGRIDSNMNKPRNP
ncbi:hypothetical protein PEX1_076330 [Penicillium expansum]|uniref:Uncharacterized protein n=1 Tax=Penicillium expansum TaxID=27334 RepID=A0A0A2I232_PENEN|nr:hypothetical protein PEX2_085470 [Penicillium expansum]KGO37164.1 hypothetical protein PEXP_001890 [Penicillium expansum]KGO54431.1 hypothetical protein PEX1_076330 [Penicillium expansum]KGO61472.1 hypothetical protein PEX2_085470 [Penicillium expansum]